MEKIIELGYNVVIYKHNGKYIASTKWGTRKLTKKESIKISKFLKENKND